MCNGAAHLVDHVIPDVPLRQWVLSVPFELRLLLAKRTDALNFVGRAFVKEVFRWQREQARRLGLAETQSGAVEWPQRFGGSLNLNVHYHVAVPDGVFTRSAVDARAEFRRLPPPRQPDLEDIALNVSVRVERWLRRKKLRRDSDEALFNNETPEPSALDACLAGSLGMGELSSLPDRGGSRTDDVLWALPKPSKASRRGGHCRGFDVHAGVVVSGSDREGRERLLRYCGRPPLSLERLSLTEEGMVAYRLRKPLGPTQTYRVMTPMQFLARVAALVPPPRCPLIRFHGVFGPHSSWRAFVVPAAGEIPGADTRRTTTGVSVATRAAAERWANSTHARRNTTERSALDPMMGLPVRRPEVLPRYPPPLATRTRAITRTHASVARDVSIGTRSCSACMESIVLHVDDAAVASSS